MKTSFITLATLALGAIASAQSVSYNYDTGADFSRFKTYKWVEIPGGSKLDDLTARQLTTAIEAELAKKGLVKVDTNNADLCIGYQVGSSQQTQINAYSSGWGMGPGWGGMGMTTATTSTLTIGSLDLDIYEMSNKQLVWRGVATKTIDPGVKPERRQQNIQRGAVKLLQNYPPKKKS